MKYPGFSLYLVTDRKSIPDKDLLTVIKSALEGGLRAVQLREKDMGGRELFALAQRLKSLTSEYGAKLFINDRLDVALGVGADGIHLGAGGFSPADLKKVWKGKLIGVSAHSVAEAIRAEREGAHFITLGPVFHTPSKERYGKPIGLGPVKEAGRKLKIPVFAIGGIKKERIGEVISSGACGVALISGVLKSADPKKSVKEMLEELSNL